MNFLSTKRHVPTVMQSQTSECGLACLTMVARYYGHQIDLSYLRAIYPITRRGMTMAEIVEVGGTLGFDGRGFALASIDDLAKIALPCVLHWNGNHFVVLEKIRGGKFTIHDPAFGKRVYEADDMRRHFSGVALEFEPRLDFTKVQNTTRSQLWSVLKSCRGLESTISQIVVVSLAVSILALMTPILLQVALDVVLPQFDLDLLTLLALGLCCFMVFEATGKWLRDFVILRSSLLFQMFFTRNVVGHSMRLPTSYFEERHPGDFVARLDSIENVKTYLVRGLVSSFADSMMSVLAVALMMYYSPQMTAFVVLTLVILVILRFMFVPSLKSTSTMTLEAHSKERQRILDGLTRFSSLKVHNAGERHAARWFQSFVGFINSDYRAKKTEITVELILHIIVAISTVVTLYIGIVSVMKAEMSVGMLYAFFALRQTFFERVNELTTQLMHLSVMGVHLQRINDIVDQKPEPQMLGSTVNRSINKDVKLVGVDIQFGRTEKPIIKDANLTIDVAKSETIAIVGPSGCGKSSLLRVLASLHTAHQGHVVIDGQPLDRFGIREFRGNIGAVFADDGLFSGTVAENLSLFDPEISTETMERALEKVGLLEDIMRLPQRLATPVSEESTLLSTGMRRRLLAARAICRAPKLFLFDEVTANLDPVSEEALVKGILSVPGAKVFVTHSGALLGHVDKVYRVKGGELVEVPEERDRARKALAQLEEGRSLEAAE